MCSGPSTRWASSGLAGVRRVLGVPELREHDEDLVGAGLGDPAVLVPAQADGVTATALRTRFSMAASLRFWYLRCHLVDSESEGLPFPCAELVCGSTPGWAPACVAVSDSVPAALISDAVASATSLVLLIRLASRKCRGSTAEVVQDVRGRPPGSGVRQITDLVQWTPDVRCRTGETPDRYPTVTFRKELVTDRQPSDTRMVTPSPRSSTGRQALLAWTISAVAAILVVVSWPLSASCTRLYPSRSG